MAPMNIRPISTGILERRADVILNNHIRLGIQRAYHKIVARYSNLCIERQLQALQPTVYTIRLFMASLAETCSGGTIANYVTAIRTYCRDNKIPCGSLMNDYGISKSIIALKHLCIPLVRSPKNAITLVQMRKIHSKLDMSSMEHSTFWAIFGILLKLLWKDV
jgi:hypothetical protein